MKCNEIIKNGVISLTMLDNDNTLANELFSLVRTKDKNYFIKNGYTSEQYESLLNYYYNKRKDYFVLSYFRDKNNDIDLKRIKLNSIFMNCIVTNNYEFLINENKGSIDAKTIKNIAIVLLNITSYCIIHNKNGNEFANILLTFYDIDNNVSFDIINSFNNNIILLKLNYIIDKLNKKDNK